MSERGIFVELYLDEDVSVLVVGHPMKLSTVCCRFSIT